MLGILRVSLMLFATGACCAANAQQAESPLGGGPIVFSGMRLASVGIAGRNEDGVAGVDTGAESAVDAVALVGVPLARRGIRSGRAGDGDRRGINERGGTSRAAGLATAGAGHAGMVSGGGSAGGRTGVTGGRRGGAGGVAPSGHGGMVAAHGGEGGGRGGAGSQGKGSRR